MLCKKRTLFDDRPVEIQELTHIVKQDIDGLQRGLIALDGAAKTIQREFECGNSEKE